MRKLIKRNLKIYFHSKVAVFFSLLGSWIAFGLYLLFLQNNLKESFVSLDHHQLILDGWVMAGILAVTGMTSTWAVATQFVKDKELNHWEDFLLSEIPKIKVQLSYGFAAMIVGVMMQVIMFGCMYGYFYWHDGYELPEGQFSVVGLLIVVSSLLWSITSLLVCQFIHKREVAERLSVIVGAVSGFLVGVYMPIGAMSESAQKVLKIFPGAHIASAFRQLLLADELQNNKGLTNEVKELLGIGLEMGHLTSYWESIIITIGATLACLIMLGLVITLSKRDRYIREIQI